MLTKVKRNNIVKFDSSLTSERLSVLAAAADHAKRMKDWEALKKAVDWQIREQRKFCEWWKANVREAGQPKKSIVSRSETILSADQAKEDTGISKLQVSRWRKRLADMERYREALFGAAYREAMTEGHNHRAQGTGENEWFTPGEYIRLAREVLGEIDLDPASSEVAQRNVQAKTFFTKKDDGLKQNWSGRVWLNPPYSQPDIGLFANKMIAEVEAGHVLQSIMLTHNYTDTSWFQKLADKASAVCFTRGRIKFVDMQGEECAPTQGQAFFYFGTRSQKFCEVFAGVGFLVLPYRSSECVATDTIRSDGNVILLERAVS